MARLIAKAAQLVKVAKVVPGLGFGNVGRFIQHRLRQKSGFYVKKLPAGAWSDGPTVDLETISNPFWSIDLNRVRDSISDPDSAIEAGDLVLERKVRYFSNKWFRIPDTWRGNPLNGFVTSLDHWSKCADFNSDQGDIKWIWEASRFEWVFTLGRAFAASRDDRYAECFWSLLEDWRANNPPNLGVNWKDGQECSFKIFALAFADGAFRSSASSTQERRNNLWMTVTRLAERIDVSVGYAVSQRNNHGISESVALYLAGGCLPKDPRSAHWKQYGKGAFERQILDQFFEDGAYIQHSFIYERLALQDAIIWHYLARHFGEQANREVMARLKSGLDFMYQIMDLGSGRVPIYGANDGANIFSLSGCEYLDFRPVVQCLSAVLNSESILPSGPWDEELAWLGLDGKPKPRAQSSFEASKSGYYVLRDELSFAMLRCHTYRSRPSHADMLALDLWIDRQNVLQDGGTFQYFDPSGVGEYLKSTAAHNTVEVNGHSQMTKFSRFLWLDWTRSKTLSFDAKMGSFLGEHFGYLKADGVIHRRQVVVRDGEWLVVDDLIAKGREANSLAMRWRLTPDSEWTETNAGAISSDLGLEISILGSGQMAVGLIPKETDSPETALSQFYGELMHTPVLKSTATPSGSFRWITIIGKSKPKALCGNCLVWHDCQVGIEPEAPIRLV